MYGVGMGIGALVGVLAGAVGVFTMQKATQYDPLVIPQVTLPNVATLAAAAAAATAHPSWEKSTSLSTTLQQDPHTTGSRPQWPVLQATAVQQYFHILASLIGEYAWSTPLLTALHTNLKLLWDWHQAAVNPEEAVFELEDLTRLAALEEEIQQQLNQIQRQSDAETSEFVEKVEVPKPRESLLKEVVRINQATSRRIHAWLERLD